MSKGILQVHPPICDCPGCRISSPVVRRLFNYVL
uniref:Sterile alpha motif domain containing 11 n=1 Tax=Meleagris gallopavo TaxID=9103 RepID=A0A803YAK1_MELGA